MTSSRGHDLYLAAKNLLHRVSDEETREAVLTLMHQLEVLIDDERHGDTEQTRARRSQLHERLTSLGLQSGEQFADVLPRGEFTTGGILAIRFTDDLFPLAHVELENLIISASKRIKSVLGANTPTLNLHGAGADFWFFEERRTAVPVVEMLRPLYLFALALQAESSRPSNGRRPISICLDYENDAATVSVLGRPTLLSARLRVAQAVLVGSRPGHVLLAREAADILNVTDDRHAELPDIARLLDVVPKHMSHRTDLVQLLTVSKKRYEFRSVAYVDDQHVVVAGATEPYIQFAAIEHRDRRDPERPGTQFSELLAAHDSCVILGVTHQELVEKHLRPAYEKRTRRGKGFWDRMIVLFPTAEAARRVMDGQATEVRLQSRAHGLRTVASFLKSLAGPSSDSWKVAEYQENLSFVGNWMSKGPRNSIRLSPLLPGLDLKETFFVELTENTTAFNEAKQSFVAIESNSIAIGEWNLVGRIQGNKFVWQRILNCGTENKNTSRNLAEAVVLVIVHGLTERGQRIYLQLRSNMNGSSAIGLYSNISGLVTTHDAYAAAQKTPPPNLFADGAAILEDIETNGVLKRDAVLPPEIWRQAAAREIDEELGLRTYLDRFVSHGSLMLARDKGAALFFEIFSLELKVSKPSAKQRSEIQHIRTARPLSGLDEGFSISEIAKLADQGSLNHLLAQNIDYFLGVYEALGVTDD